MILKGTLQNFNKLNGSLTKEQGLEGSLSNESLTGTLQSVQTLKGSFSKEETLEGNLSNGVLQGYSAYQVAVLNGFEGTEEEWLASLQGKPIVMKQIGNALYWRYDNETDKDFRLLVDLTNQEKDYQLLFNKPRINGVELLGSLSLSDLGLIGSGLKFDETTNKLAVDVTDDVEQDNTLPITSASVYTTVGNIQELLKTI